MVTAACGRGQLGERDSDRRWRGAASVRGEAWLRFAAEGKWWLRAEGRRLQVEGDETGGLVVAAAKPRDGERRGHGSST